MNKVRELHWIANEENGSVISNHVPISFFGVLKRVSSALVTILTNLTENPLGSLAESAEPFSPPTVENRVKMGVRLPTWLRNLALQYLVMSLVTSKYP